MKNRILLCLMSVVLVLSLFSFTSCNGESDPTEPSAPVSTTPQSTVPGGVSFDTPHEYDTPFISSDLLVELKTKYYEWKTGEGEKIDPEDVFVWRYYGVYGDCHMVRLMPKSLSDISSCYETVAGYSFYHYQYSPAYAYKDGEFYTLTQAYDGGLLSSEQIKTFRDSIDGGGKIIDTPIPEEYLSKTESTDPFFVSVPSEADTPYINQRLACEIRTAFNKWADEEGYTFSNTAIRGYAGKVADCHIFYIATPATDVFIIEEVVAGYTFYRNGLFTYSNGEVYSLLQAYEGGLLTKRDVYEVGCLTSGESFKESYPDPPTEELYEVLVCDFSNSIPSVKDETEYVFADYEKYKDAPIDDTVEMIINGTKYSGKYQGSEYIAYNIFPSYVYLTEEGVEFLIDETGMLTHYFWKDEPLQDTKKTKDECVMIARDFLAGYVDVDQYEIEVDDHPDGRELYEVKFYKKLGDFKTTDTARVTVKADGSIYLYSSFMLGKVDKDAISAASVDLEKIRASVNERLNSIYKDVKDYYSRVEYDEKYVELTTLKDGSLGVIYTVDVRFIETRGEYEIWRSERISFVVLID